MREVQHVNWVNNAYLLFAAAPVYAEYLAQDEALARLLRARMAEIRVPLADQAFFAGLTEPVYVVAVAPNDSPSTVAVLPIVARVAAMNPLIDLRVLQEDEGIELLGKIVDDEDFLDSLPEMDLPLVVLFDRDRQYLTHWGPHPQALDPYLDDWLNRHPDFEALVDDESAEGQTAYVELLEQLTHEVRLWFNSGLNHVCVAELRALFPSSTEDDAEDEDAGDESGDEPGDDEGYNDNGDENGDAGDEVERA